MVKQISLNTILNNIKYLILPTGCIDTGQTRSMQEATVMQTDADEVSSTVGGGTYKYPTTGHKVVNLDVEKIKPHTSNGNQTAIICK